MCAETYGCAERASGSTGARMANTVANFYTDETPGIKMSPVSLHAHSGGPSLPGRAEELCLQIVIVVMSLTFIGFVTLLHIIGKVRAVRNAQSCTGQTHSAERWPLQIRGG